MCVNFDFEKKFRVYGLFCPTSYFESRFWVHISECGAMFEPHELGANLRNFFKNSGAGAPKCVNSDLEKKFSVCGFLCPITYFESRFWEHISEWH